MKSPLQYLDFIKHFWLLLFDPDQLIQESIKRSPSANGQELESSVRKLRKHVVRAFWVVSSATFLAVLVHLVLSFFGIPIPHAFLIGLRLSGYFLILWGVLSPVGYAIKTWDGDSLPEIVDEEWHKWLYLVGVFGLFLSYLSELNHIGH